MDKIANQIRRGIPHKAVPDGIEFNSFDTYDFIEGLWISKISVTDKFLIHNSNHFINHIITTNDYGQENGIYGKEKEKNIKYIPELLQIITKY